MYSNLFTDVGDILYDSYDNGFLQNWYCSDHNGNMCLSYRWFDRVQYFIEGGG